MEIQERVRYGSFEVMNACQVAAARIAELKRNVVTDLVQIGRKLAEVKGLLPHGEFCKWVEQEAGMTVSMAWKCRRLAEYVERWPILKQFSIEAALAFPDLEADLRDRILEREAFSWTAFNREVEDWTRSHWREGMEKRLAGEDCKTPWEERVGDVLHWTREAMGADDQAIAQEAQAFYQEHREEFARLADSPPSVVDADVGWREPRDQGGQCGYLDDCCEMWACVRKPDGGWEPVMPLRKVVTLWPEPPRPALYLTRDGPATEAWQASAMDLLLERRRIRERVGEVL